MTVTTVEIPTHCPLCHKSLGTEDGEEGNDIIRYIVLPNATTACIQCWNLTQEMIIRGMPELPDFVVRLRKWGQKWRKRLSLRYWLVEKPHNDKVALRHSGEVPAVEAEVPEELN